MARVFRNPAAGRSVDPAPVPRGPLEFHRRLPGYSPTPLIKADSIASALGVGEVWVKDESNRLGLPSFKILGASWAAYRALVDRLGRDPGPWRTPGDLAVRLAPLRPLALATATDGNHGRAVARMAALLGFEARIFVPAGTTAARIEAIRGEGAAVWVVEGDYDDAVARAAREAGERCLVVSDTSWEGYDRVPRWVIEGYSTIFHEADEQLAAQGGGWPDLVAAQIGVGALAAAVVHHYRRPGRGKVCRIAGVEPVGAACALAAMEAGRIVRIPGPHRSVMAGLNCGAVSKVAWPALAAGIDLFVAIEDDRACEAVRRLAGAGIVSGESGGAGLGGLLELLTGAGEEENRAFLGVGSSTLVLVVSTEGATDPDSYRRIVGEGAGG